MAIDETTEGGEESAASALSRRRVIQGGSAVAISAAAWSAPAITGIGLTPAYGANASTTTCYMLIGDSITIGNDGSDMFDGSYRGPLWNSLVGAGNSIDYVGPLNTQPFQGPVVNDTHCARNGGRILTADPPQVQFDVQGYLGGAGPTPDIALVHLGTNDLGSFVNDGDTPAQAVSNTFNDMVGLVQVLLNANAAMHVYVAQIIPRVGSLQITMDLNAAYANLPSTFPASSVHVVDMYSGFNQATMFNGTVHPNFAGGTFMAGQWYSALQGNGHAV